MASCSSVAPTAPRRLLESACLPKGFLPLNLMLAGPLLGCAAHLRLDGASTKLSYCNGEIGAGSSNITPYMVWGCERPLWVAQTLRQLTGFWVETGRRWEGSRERFNASAGRSTSAMGALCQLAFMTAPDSFFMNDCPMCRLLPGVSDSQCRGHFDARSASIRVFWVGNTQVVS